MRVLVCTAIICCVSAALVAPAAAVALSTWDAVALSVFPVRAWAPDFPVECTGWYADRISDASQHTLPVSVYVTAGHCPTPQVVDGAGALRERTVILAQMVDPGPDMAVGGRLDPRPSRVFLTIAAGAAAPGTRALIVGFAGGHLTQLLVTALPASDCSGRFACFHSETPVRRGLSGAPIVSLDTGEVVGMLVATPDDRHGNDDTHTVLATPPSVLRAAMLLVLPRASAPSSQGPFETR